MKINNAIREVSGELNIDPIVATRAYNSCWKYIKDKIQDLDFSNITEKEFKQLKTNFNMPSLCKIYTSYDKIEGAKKRFEYLNKLKDDKSTR